MAATPKNASFDQRAESAGWVRLVNLRPGTMTFRPPYDHQDLAERMLAEGFENIPRADWRRPERGIEVPYLGATPWVPRAYAELHMKRARVGRGMLNRDPVTRAAHVLRRVIAPSPGTTLTDRVYLGKTYKVCNFQGSVAQGTAQDTPVEVRISEFRPPLRVPCLYHSVGQALDHMAVMTDVDDVKLYCSVDRRPVVLDAGQRMISWLSLIAKAIESPNPQEELEKLQKNPGLIDSSRIY